MIPKDKLVELKDVAQRANDPENLWGFAFAIEYINKCDPALILSMIAEIEKMQKADEIAECTSASLYGLYTEAHARAERIEKEADWLADNLAERDCPHNCPSEEAPMLEECAVCWRGAAKAAIAGEAEVKKDEVEVTNEQN